MKKFITFIVAVLRLIKMVIDNGHSEGIWVGMCGEMAGDRKNHTYSTWNGPGQI